MMVKIGELYKSVDYGYVVEVVEIHHDYKVLKIVESDTPERIGDTLHAAIYWPERYANLWEYVPSKSENFNSLYNKLNNDVENEGR